jgi:hypothetical protein
MWTIFAEANLRRNKEEEVTILIRRIIFLEKFFFCKLKLVKSYTRTIAEDSE